MGLAIRFLPERWGGEGSRREQGYGRGKEGVEERSQECVNTGSVLLPQSKTHQVNHRGTRLRVLATWKMSGGTGKRVIFYFLLPLLQFN